MTLSVYDHWSAVKRDDTWVVCRCDALGRTDPADGTVLNLIHVFDTEAEAARVAALWALGASPLDHVTPSSLLYRRRRNPDDV